MCVVKVERKFDIDWLEAENRLNFRGEYWNKGIMFKSELIIIYSWMLIF